jgi:hypothetical protein
LLLRLDTISNAAFPSLEVLGVYNVQIERGSGALECFPAVRHLNFDYDEDCYQSMDAADQALINDLSPQLFSFFLMAGVYLGVQSKVPPTLTPSLLVNLPWHVEVDFNEAITHNVHHLRLLAPSVVDELEIIECDQIINAITAHLGSCDRYPRLESVYLPGPGSLPEEYRSKAIVDALKNLSFTCRNRDVEVIYEEQSDQRRAETLISEEFMRRMRKRGSEWKRAM